MCATNQLSQEEKGSDKETILALCWLHLIAWHQCDSDIDWNKINSVKCLNVTCLSELCSYLQQALGFIRGSQCGFKSNLCSSKALHT